MRYERPFTRLSDDELLLRLRSILQDSRRTESDLVAHIGEVESRRLYAREASPSMHAYCTDVLHLSEAEAYLRVHTARAARRYPVILEMLTDGRLHLSAIAKLAPHLDSENHAVLLARATHKTKRQVEDLVAELNPRPDAPSLIRKLPVKPEAEPSLEVTPPATSVSRPHSEAILDRSSQAPTRIAPLSPERYKVQFTASGAFRAKLERLQALMRTRFPDGDLAKVLEEAVTEKLERLEARRFAKTARPRSNEVPRDDGSRRLPAALKRAVNVRDDDRCRYVDDRGRRCAERQGLQYHHRDPFGRGGERTVANICLMCPAHNQYLADRDYGKETMDRHRMEGRRGLADRNGGRPVWNG
jgi:hypothetical protein